MLSYLKDKHHKHTSRSIHSHFTITGIHSLQDKFPFGASNLLPAKIIFVYIPPKRQRSAELHPKVRGRFNRLQFWRRSLSPQKSHISSGTLPTCIYLVKLHFIWLCRFPSHRQPRPTSYHAVIGSQIVLWSPILPALHPLLEYIHHGTGNRQLGHPGHSDISRCAACATYSASRKWRQGYCADPHPLCSSRWPTELEPTEEVDVDSLR